jgi:hypothetical protein
MIAAERVGIGYFGDMRRERAGASLFERVVASGSLVLREIGGSRAGELSANRFLGSPYVAPGEIVRTAGQRTAAACAGRRIVAAQDTTEINFKDRARRRKGLGSAGDGQSPGFFCHAMIAIMPMKTRCSEWCTHASGRGRAIG